MLVIKRLDNFLKSKFFIGFMFDCTLSASPIGAENNNITISELLNKYNDYTNFAAPNNNLFTEFFLNKYSELLLNNTYQELEGGGVNIYPKECFCMPTHNKSMGYAVHYFNNSWREKRLVKSKKYLLKLIGEINYFKLLNYKAVKTLPFYMRYKIDKKK